MQAHLTTNLVKLNLRQNLNASLLLFLSSVQVEEVPQTRCQLMETVWTKIQSK